MFDFYGISTDIQLRQALSKHKPRRWSRIDLERQGLFWAQLWDHGRMYAGLCSLLLRK
jgi:hypothetical protein